MKKVIRNISYLLLTVFMVSCFSSCNNEDDVIEIFTKNSWKLSRLTTKNSSARFLPNLWNNDDSYKASMNALDEDYTYILNFSGAELNGEIMGTAVDGRGIKATFSGTWAVDGAKRTLTFNIKVVGKETDPLAKAFIDGLSKVYKYEGDSNSLTFFFEDVSVTKVMGFTPAKKQ